MAEIIAQGAEAVILTQVILSSKLLSEEVVIKHRITRKYRHHALDSKIRQKRLLQEARNMLKVRKIGVPVPSILMVDDNDCKLYMQKITPSFTVKEFLLAVTVPPQVLLEDLSMQIGKNIA